MTIFFQIVKIFVFLGQNRSKFPFSNDIFLLIVKISVFLVKIGQNSYCYISLFVQGSIKYLTLNDQSKIWLADLFFANERRGHFHKMIIPNVYLRIYPDGWVLYSIR